MNDTNFTIGQQDLFKTRGLPAEKEQNVFCAASSPTIINAFVLRGSKFLKKEERDERVFKTSLSEDYCISANDKDLVERFNPQYVLEPSFVPIADASPRLKQLSTLHAWKCEELQEKGKELITACNSAKVMLKDAEHVENTHIRDLAIRCHNLREEQRQLKEQIAHIEAQNPPHNSTWPDPIELKEELPAAEALSPDILPSFIKPFIIDAANRIQCSLDFVAAGVVVVFSAIIGAGCCIRPLRKNNWTVVPNLWGGIIGFPGAKKTPALNEAMQLLAPLEKEADLAFQEGQLRAGIEEAEYDIRQSDLKNRMKEAIREEATGQIGAAKEALLSLKTEWLEARVKWKRYKTNDSTIEKLIELLADNPRGLLMFRDELIGFLSTFEREGREDSRAFFLEAWAGYASSKVKSDRIGRGTTSCNPCISVLGSIQPTKLRQYLYDTLHNINNDGLLQRFQVLVYPDKPKAWKLVDQSRDRDAFENAQNIAKILAHTDFYSFGAQATEDLPIPYFQFDNKSQEFFNQWLQKLENRILNEQEDGIFLEHLAKYRSLMPSLALIFHLIRCAGEQSRELICLQDTELAVKWCTYLESHAKRIYAIIEGKAIFAAKALLKKIQQGKLGDNFTQRDVYRKEWTGLSRQETEEACNELVAHGWLKEERITLTDKGGAPSTRYRLHPSLLKLQATKN